jgi:hypothetical protein
MGGASIGGMGGVYVGGLIGSGFAPFVRKRHMKSEQDDEPTPVNLDALANLNHPGHREAITTISHVDDDRHGQIIRWLRDELRKLVVGSDSVD